jgi:2-polyprenyl-3-methyl-5-hydroxy-6-metoxy-1,4-benzoquinol methylase
LKANVLSLDSVRYNIIFCTEVLEHIRDTETPIPIMLKLLDDGGSLVLTVPNGAATTRRQKRSWQAGCRMSAT